MDSFNSDNDAKILNPINLSDDHEESQTMQPQSFVLESEVAKENISSPVKKKDSKSNNPSTRKWHNTQPVMLVISMVIVAAVLQIPFVLYYTDPPSTESTLFDNIDLESCSVSNPQLFQSSSTTALITLCTDENELCLDCNETESLELEVLQAVYGLSSVLENGQCSEALLQFLCNAINAVNNDSYELIRECLMVRDNECAAEWRITENFFGVPLPSCDSFNESINFTSARAPVLSCPDDFGTFCGSLCQPLCAEISLFNDAATTAYVVLNIIFHTLSVIAGVITILACFVNKRKMFTFPLIFVVYNTIVFEIISLFLLLPYIFGSDALLCSHPNLIVTNSKSTAFCQTQGFIIQSGALIFFGFWVFHLLHILHSLMNPMRSQILMKSKKFRRNIHLIEVLVTLICGLLPSIIITATSGYHYSGFPPVCSSEIPEVIFYTLIFPISIEATFGLCMLLASLYILRKNFHVKISKTGYSTPETKLMILFSYYGISIISVLIHLVVNLRSIDTIVDNISSFTLCSAGGYRVECDGYRENLNNKLIPSIVFDLITTFFISFVNIVNLLYVLQYNDIKRGLSKMLSSITNSEF